MDEGTGGREGCDMSCQCFITMYPINTVPSTIHYCKHHAAAERMRDILYAMDESLGVVLAGKSYYEPTIKLRALLREVNGEEV